METYSALLAICAQTPVTRSLVFSFICAWLNGWVNNREAGDLRRHWALYDVPVMSYVDSGAGQASGTNNAVVIQV